MIGYGTFQIKDAAQCERCVSQALEAGYRPFDTAHLGKHRWVVERTFAWFHRYRRLLVRYERRADIHLAFFTLAAALISFRFC